MHGSVGVEEPTDGLARFSPRSMPTRREPAGTEEPTKGPLAWAAQYQLGANLRLQSVSGGEPSEGGARTRLDIYRFESCLLRPVEDVLPVELPPFKENPLPRRGRGLKIGHEYSNDLRAIGRQIRGMRALMTHWEAVLGERLLTLDYEALVADPESFVRRMVAHVGIEWDDACLRPHEVARTVRTASAWQVRQPVYRRSAGRAQRYQRFLGPLREGLGESPAGG